MNKGALHIFDIDDTLMHTNAQIHVKNGKGETVRKLSNQEFNDHKLKPGHKYDFKEFEDSKKFHDESTPMPKTLEQLKRVHKKIKLKLTPNSKIIMNTARSDFDDKDKFLDTFKKHGVDIDNIHVHRAGNIKGNDLPAKKKLVYIRHHLNQGQYSEAHMYDDSKTNLHHFKSLKNEYPHVKFHAWHIQHDGSMRKV